MFFVLGENSRSTNANDLSNPYFRSNGDNPELHERFNEKNVSRIFEAKKTMESPTQGSNTVTTYYTRLKALWDQIRKSQILMRDPLPSVNKAYAAVVQEERQRGLSSGCNSSFDVDKVSSSNNGQFVGAVQPFRSKYNCTHCGMDEGKPEEMLMERDLISSLSSVQCQKLMAFLA
uniref:Retrotransposon gag domain-containing protein n=1 Tax=Cannabis sativa TaxID=3483 RepID=A0A803QB07_CANSA